MSAKGQFGLLAERRFGPFFATQFLGALNDNVFKNALVIAFTYQAAAWSSLSASSLSNLAQALFILPFFLFSAQAGQLADKFERSRIIRLVKLAEVLIMLLAWVGFALHDLVLLLGALFLMGVHSTVFGPVKYAILPQHLREEELIGGNALVESGTFLAILLGTLLGGILFGLGGGTSAALACLGLAIAGYAASRGVPRSPAPAPELRIDWNPVRETWRNLRFTAGNRTVFNSVLGVSWFWFYGAMFLAQFPAYARDTLGGAEQVVTLLLAVFSIGIGAGSLLCERLSGRKVEIGLVPFGSIGMTLIALDLYFASPAAALGTGLTAAQFLQQAGSLRILADLVLIGIFGGLFVVPLYALIQTRTDVTHRSRVIAGNNILNAAFVVVAALLAIGLLQAGLRIADIFLVTAALNAAVAVYIYTLVPEFLMRFIIWLLIHSVYRLQKSGLEHIPEEGPAVLVSNHVSFVDALVIAAACRRPIRFVMDHQIYRLPVLNFVFRTGRTIPIASARTNPDLLDRAYDQIAAALEAGELVCIFPEGRITDTGEMYPFRNGIRRIIARTPVPVVPLALRGLWGSFFSRKGGRAMSRPYCRAPFQRIAIAVGLPLAPAEVTPDALQTVVQGLRGDWR
ncbi:MAG: MFS transporter [Betaproteobacteria bacterium]|nr:MAG: MFS transporter [Betaproteobacteria bacterium]